MGYKSFIVKPFARWIARGIEQWAKHPIEAQKRIFNTLIKNGQKTLFGKDHRFDEIHNYPSFTERVPLRDYEALKPYIEKIKRGEQNILWPGVPQYLAKTSGTTSGVKYIPLTKDSLPNHFGTARNALFNYFAKTGNGQWLDGHMIFLSGSPELEKVGNILTGRLSGIVNHQVPSWLRTNQKPSYKTNIIEDWEKKLDKIVEETLRSDMRLISGIPPWVQMYYERLLEVTGKKHIKDIFPNYSVFVFGGVNYEPYRDALEELVGKRIDSIETYPASEGFIAFQDDQNENGLLLNVNSGIYFEFVPAEEIFNEQPTRLALEQVELGVNYAVIINNNAGLWGYNIGDTVQFVSKSPYRLLVTGRIKHFISAFGEHVIGQEVEAALLLVAKQKEVAIVEFSVAPQIHPEDGGLPHHEWYIEFNQVPKNLEAFALAVDRAMNQQNIYYKDLIDGKILQPLKIIPLKKGAFRMYMKQKGKLGGQNKVPRLSNDRKIAEALKAFRLIDY